MLEAAYQVLSNATRRARYDRLIAQHAASASRPQQAKAAATPAARRVRHTVSRRGVAESTGRALATARRHRGPSLIVEMIKHLMWWGLSAAVHALMLLILANWYMLSGPVEEVYTALVVDFVPPPPKVEPLDISSSPDIEPPSLEPKVEPPKLDEIIDQAAIAELARQAKSAALAVKTPFGARTASGRAAAIGSGGATKGSESAVNLGLLWLSTHQLSTGAWRTDKDLARWADPGITGLATLAFLGAGHTHRKGKYRYHVARALAYLKQQQDLEGGIGRKGVGRRAGHMYCHGICTLALVEAYAMTRDSLLREPAERAVDFICKTQNSTGGWRYYHNSPDGDSSVAGWMVMALRSAKLAGILVPDKTFAEARRFFDSVTNLERGYTVYMPGMQPTSPALVAVGLLCHQYLNPKPNEAYIKLASTAINTFHPRWIPFSNRERMSLDNLPATKPGANAFYFWYYANMALHQRRDDAWDKWHPRVRDTLTKCQVRTGKDEGSWPPKSRWALRGGRVYSTAMAIITLEVYYRYAPIYREVVDKVLAAYGATLDAYNHYVRTTPRTSPAAAKAYGEAVAKIQAYLALTEPTEGKPLAKGTDERRRRCTSLLLNLHRIAAHFDKAIALLERIPRVHPGLLKAAKRKELLAQCQLARSRQLITAGKTAEAAEAESMALDLLEELLAAAPGKDPKLALYVAEQLFVRKNWERALKMFRDHAARLKGKGADQKTLVYLYRRIIACATELRRYRTAALWLRRLRKVVGPTLDMLREEATLERRRGRHAAARKIYESILPRVEKLSAEWWRTLADAYEMALREGRSVYVAKQIERLRILYPKLGGRASQRRLLGLLRQAERGA